METNEVPVVKMCSTCGKNPRAYPNTSNSYCLECAAAQKRAYAANMKKQTADQAYARGVAAAKGMLIGEFLKLAAGVFSGHQVAELIRDSKGPRFDDVEA